MDEVELETTCPRCHIKHVFRVPAVGYQRWRDGAMIQDALPGLSPTVREMMITGYCGPCFDDVTWEGE